MTTATRTAYTCKGSVRGSCGHVHRTLSGASQCCKRDRRACKKQGGYSDRDVRNADGTQLSENEYHKMIRLNQS
jgi:hypothetical protein